MSIIIRRPWTSQPQIPVVIDRSNSLGGKVLFCILGGRIVTDNRPLSWVGAPGSGFHPQGRMNSFGGSSQNNITGRVRVNIDTPKTFAYFSQIGASPPAFAGVAHISGTTGTHGFELMRSTNATYTTTIKPASSSSTSFKFGGVMVAGTTERVVIRAAVGMSSTTSGDYAAWINGASSAITAGPGFTPQPVGSSWLGWDNADSKFVGLLDEFVIFEGGLSSEEVASYYANPWQLFAPLPSRIWAPVGVSGVSGTFTVNTVGDSESASGTTTILGAFTKTTVNDSASISGTTTIVGTFAQTAANDTMTASGTVGGVSGTFTVTIGDDGNSLSGTTTIIGSVTKTTVSDGMSASGATTIVGLFSTTNTNDSMSAYGYPGAPPTATARLPLTGVGT